MSTMKTVAAFDSQAEIERTIDTLVDAGIDPAQIEVVLAEEPVSDGALETSPADADAPDSGPLKLAVTAPHEDTTLVQDILREGGEIDLAASETPAVGWAGDPEGENLDKSRTPAIGWAGKAGRPG